MPPISLRKYVFIVVGAALCALITWTIWQNHTVSVTHFTAVSRELPPSFSGFKIAQVSDLHNASFGPHNEDIIDALNREKPDMIALTGDLISSTHLDMEIATQFIKRAQNIAPCYFVTGNHEARIGSDYLKLKKNLKNAGVVILENKVTALAHGNDFIQIAGLEDPEFVGRASYLQKAVITRKLKDLPLQRGYTLLLSHRPEAFEEYRNAHIDLVLSGHTHGGQLRLPFIGALVAPNQGLFPRFDSGSYSDGKTTMFISRGLGSSVIPFRFNDQPELVFITLQTR